MSSPILWSVVFDLTFFNEVSKQHVTIKDIHAQVLDSCIAIIVGRPIIRENHLVHIIPLYFDEIPRSKPDLSQPVEPVTTPVKARANVVERSLVAHTPHLWHKAAAILYARCRC